MFHVERDIIVTWKRTRNVNITGETEEKMLRFADMIHSENQKFNLTGLKTRIEILSELILKSLDPVCDIIVPRGTRFADIGTGAGIPGIPLSLFFSSFSGTLIESSRKKAGFVKRAADELGLTGLEIICGRAEELAADREHREHYDRVFTRAFGKLFITLEISVPFIKKNGLLYIYSTLLPEQISAATHGHFEKLGLDIMSHKQMKEINLAETGLCFLKKRNTPDKYPRKYPIIKREAEKL